LGPDASREREGGADVTRRQVMHLISSSGFYGAERVVLDLCRASLSGPFPPLVASFFDLREPHLELHEAAEKEGLPTRLLTCRGRMDLNALQQLRHVLIQDGVKILHCHGFKADFYGLLTGRPLKIPLIATSHLWTKSSPVIRWYERLDGLCLRFFDRVVAVSSPIRDELVRAGVPGKKVTVIPNGLYVDDFSHNGRGVLRSELGLGEEEIVIGTIARLSPEKGHGHLLRAARAVLQEEPKARFLLVGDGPLRRTLEQEVAAMGLTGSVIFGGERTDMPEVYALSDLIVSASLREGFPLSILEALAAGRPVVATRVGGVPEIVQDGVTGILVDPGDEVGLAKAILGVLRDAPRRRALGRAGRKVVEERFSVHRMAREYFEVYAGVVGESVDQSPTCSPMG
jgi:glycosyltransferase involved in cell wall biosynthesis